MIHTISTTIPNIKILDTNSEIKSDIINSELCPSEYFYKNLITNECEKFCLYNEFINGICYINNLNEKNIKNITQNIRDLMK